MLVNNALQPTAGALVILWVIGQQLFDKLSAAARRRSSRVTSPKSSGPLLDRIDIHIDVSTPSCAAESQPRNRPRSASVGRARARQQERFLGTPLFANAQMSTRQVRRYSAIDEAGERLLENAITRMRLSARAHAS